MTAPRQDLIDALAGGLEAVHPRRPTRLALAWLLGAGVLICAGLWAIGPFRAGAMHDLLHAPHLALETVLGAATLLALGHAGLALAVPDGGRPWRRALPALLMLVSWLLLHVAELWWPSLEPSMRGKRPHCLVEGLACGALTLLAGLVLARRLWPLHGAWSGALLGLGAGALPALIMQFACMVVPQHTLALHLLPGLAQGVAGALLGAWWLRPRRA